MKGLHIEKNRIAVIGFGISGRSITKYFIRKGVSVDVFEDKKESDFDVQSIAEYQNESKFSITYDASNASVGMTQYDYVVASPGVWLTHPIIVAAQKSDVEFLTDINVFLRLFRSSYPNGKVISITGSNGKSTTVSLMYEALMAARQDVYLGGNIGTSPLDFFEVIQTEHPIVILETSSYQLEYLKEQDYFDIAGITNISDNHLNRYNGQKSLYAKAKLGGIHPEHTEAIINLDDEDSQKYVVPYLNALTVLPVQFNSQDTNSDIITLEEHAIVSYNKGAKTMLLENTSQMKIQGLHNIYNTAFTCAVFTLLDISMNREVQQAIYDFGGLIHRTQFVDKINSVTYINDSKSTSPDATSKALETLGSSKNIVLISGGNDKDISYTAMQDGWTYFVDSLILLPGTANSKLKELANESDVKLIAEVQTMSEAVDLATTHATENGIVLLSPATDSHASFKSFEDRGNQFIQCVKELKN